MCIACVCFVNKAPNGMKEILQSYVMGNIPLEIYH